MKKVGIYIGLIIIGLIAGYWFGYGSKDESKHSHNEMLNQEWTCSMHPQIRQNEPGKCPLCGMDLIPITENDSGKSLGIRMSPTAMQLAKVVTEKVKQSVPNKEIRLNGKLSVDETKVFTLSSHIPGRIEKLMVNYTGETISKGQILAYVYSPELITAQEELFEAIKIKDKQVSLYNASKEKLKNWKLSDVQIEEIIKGGKVQELFPVLADQTGIVLEKKVNIGDYIKKGQAMYITSNLEQLWVLLDVYEKDLSWVKKGDKVQFEVQSFPGDKFEANVIFIDPVINSKSRVAKARLKLNNQSLRFKPDMFVSALLLSPFKEHEEVINIPKSAVMWTGKRSIVYVKEQTKNHVSFEMRQIEIGSLIGDNYVVKSGLELGEEIAVNGTFSIDAAAQLAGKPSMMNNINDEIANTRFKLNQDAKIAIQNIIDQYLIIKDMLVKDNYKGIDEEIIKFDEILSGIKMTLFHGEAHDYWMKKESLLRGSVKLFKESKDIEQFRKVFVDFSHQVNEISKSSGPYEHSYYVQRCPMANNDQGAEWLSKEKEVLNPYFGASMLRCGEVVHEIK